MKLEAYYDDKGCLVACGFNNQKEAILIERRADGNDLVHTDPYAINDEKLRGPIRDIMSKNHRNGWTDEKPLSDIFGLIDTIDPDDWPVYRDLA